MKENDEYIKLSIFLGESDQWQGRPLWQVLLERMVIEGLAGATVIRGLAGFGAHSRIKIATLVNLSADLPLMIIAIDRAGKIEKVLPILSTMINEGMIAIEPVTIIKYLHRFSPKIPPNILVKDAMTKDVFTASPDMPIWEAASLLLKHVYCNASS